MAIYNISFYFRYLKSAFTSTVPREHNLETTFEKYHNGMLPDHAYGFL